MLFYRYSPLRKHDGAESIRLLRLLPNDDENATIACQLVDYFLPHSDTGPHLCEALSYVWGHPRKKHSITLDNCSFGVTANLHAALTRLRNRYIERVVWIDAICVNQGDLKERGYQIGCMARIYGKAKCVAIQAARRSSVRYHRLCCKQQPATTTHNRKTPQKCLHPN